MNKTTAFDHFAPTILQVYHRNKEAFWAAVMAPFLSNNTALLDWVRHLRVDIGLLSAFRGLDDEARRALQAFSAPLGLDVTTWPSNRLQYFKDAYPVFAFLAVWMDEEGLHDLVDQFADTDLRGCCPAVRVTDFPAGLGVQAMTARAWAEAQR